MSDASISRLRSPDYHGTSTHFARHLAEMALAMMVGMMASAMVFFGVTGMAAEEALRRHPVFFVVIQAAGMTIAMVGWMRFRRHEWQRCNEMAAAMIAPAVVLICLRLVGAIGGPICGLYCALSFIAMIAVMRYRSRDYGGVAVGAPQPGCDDHIRVRRI